MLATILSSKHFRAARCGAFLTALRQCALGPIIKTSTFFVLRKTKIASRNSISEYVGVGSTMVNGSWKLKITINTSFVTVSNFHWSIKSLICRKNSAPKSFLCKFYAGSNIPADMAKNIET